MSLDGVQVVFAHRYERQLPQRGKVDELPDPARVRAAVRLDGRRVIVRLHLEADVILVVELHDAGVVREDADAPIVVAEFGANFLRRGEHGFLEQVFEGEFALFVAVPHPAPQRLVRAMFTPGLGDRFELGVGGLAVLLAEMPADRLHLGQTQVKLPLAAETGQFVVIHSADRNGHQPIRVIGTDRQVRGRLLDVLRGNDLPVTRDQLDVVWLRDTVQRDRALESLLADGLVAKTSDGRFALAGEED